jgi:hypothetical protein
LTAQFKYFLLGILILGFYACKDKKSGSKQDILADYNGKYLYKSDIPEDVWTAYNSGDSSGLLKSIVDKWIEKTALLEAAENTLTDEQKNKERLIEDYRSSLLIYEYQQQLVKEKLDTGVTDIEISAFYNENKAAFQLKKNIVKIRYVKINKQKADLNKLQRLMQNPSPANDNELRLYAEKQADNFYTDSNWLFLADITKEIPLDENYNQQRFLANSKYISIEENGILYLLYIIDFRIKDALSPLEFEKEKIKDIILYQRKLKFLKDIQNSLYQKASKGGDIKYYLDIK